MKKIKRHYILIFLLLASNWVFAVILDNGIAENKEKVALFTDRSVYIAGEQLHFSATLYSSDNFNYYNQSKVIYCELITPDGNKITGYKYLVNKSSAEGCIAIPGDQVTGIYYLRAYTKEMRNFGPETYSYIQLRIVNPGRSEVLAGENHEQLIEAQNAQPGNNGAVEQFSLTTDHSEYASRDTVILSIKAAQGSASGLKGLCLSVVPEMTESSFFFSQESKGLPHSENSYFKESLGVSITGKITGSTSKYPVTGRRVNLSIIGDGRDFMAVRTDSAGRFFFALPEFYGSRDLFLSAENAPATEMKIWIDNDFCTMPVHLPSPAFSLTDPERQVVVGMAANVQIKSHFQPDTLQQAETEEPPARAFYGVPTKVLSLDQYVQLPTLEEYFNELPGLVKVRKRNGEKYFKVMGANDLSFYDPLVLVDWVAVNDPVKILAITPQNISRIEFVTRLYVKGGQTYGGIISIISKKGDFAGIDLPSTGIFINYRFLAENQCIENSVDAIPIHPDFRNTLLWEPAISLLDEKADRFSFRAPDTPGKYVAILEGITGDGTEFRKTLVFEVKN